MKFGLTIFLLHAVSVASQIDRTRQADTYGSDVVDAVVSMLHDACIYMDSHLFLRRLAYAESQDGVNPKTYRQGYDGGIWQVDRPKFNIAKSKILPEMSDTIRHKLGIDWTTATWSDLRKPLYSGLAAAIFLKTKGAPDNVPSSMDDQGAYWITNYRPSGLAAAFVNLANQLDVGCHKEHKMDILFLLDTSGPVFKPDHVKAFMKNFVSSVDVGPNNVQIAVESFGPLPQVNIPLAAFPEKQSLLAALDSLTFPTGHSGLDRALSKASKDVFGAPTSRQNVDKVIILLSAAKMNLSMPALKESIQMKNRGISIFTVGTGLSNNALHQLASEPVCSHSYTFTDYTSLETLHPFVEDTSCRVAVGLQVGDYTYPCGSNVLVRVQSSSIGTSVKVDVDNGTAEVFGSYVNSQPSKDVNNVNNTIDPSQPAQFFIRDKRPLTLAVNSEFRHQVSCYGNIRITVEPSVAKRTECQKRKPDIILLLDTSSSKSQIEFKNMLDFASRFSDQFKIGPDDTQIGLVTYADTPTNQFWLKTYTRQEDLQNDIRSLPMFGSKSNLASALKFVREQAFTLSYGMRSDSSRILVVVTGASSDNPKTVETQGQLLKNEGVRVVVVAADKAARDPVIGKLGSGMEHVQMLKSYSDMPGAVNKAVVESCGDIQLICMENGLQRDCRLEDLLITRFGPLLVPEHGGIPNSPCSMNLPVDLHINRFPHPTDKDKFILCDNKGQTYLVLCPVQEIYNGNTTNCELPPSQTLTPNKQTTSGYLPAIITTRPPPSQSTTKPPTGTAPPVQQTGGPCSGDNIARGLYFHPYIPDQHKYIHCTGMPDSSKLETCPPMKIWRQESMQCEFEFITDKDGKAVTSLHNPCVFNKPAYFPHPTNKQAYIQCDAFGEGFLLNCPAGTVFMLEKACCV